MCWLVRRWASRADLPSHRTSTTPDSTVGDRLGLRGTGAAVQEPGYRESLYGLLASQHSIHTEVTSVSRSGIIGPIKPLFTCTMSAAIGLALAHSVASFDTAWRRRWT